MVGARALRAPDARAVAIGFGLLTETARKGQSWIAERQRAPRSRQSIARKAMVAGEEEGSALVTVLLRAGKDGDALENKTESRNSTDLPEAAGGVEDDYGAQAH